MTTTFAASWHGGSSTPRCSTTRRPRRTDLLPAAHGAHGLRPWCRCRRAIRCVGRRSNRVSTRRCGDAPAPGARLDAQPGADDHRVVPREGPAHRLDPRGAALHGPPDRRRPGQQPARLAVDGRDGDRRRPRTSGSSTRSARAASSIPTATTSAAWCRSWRRCPAPRSTTRGSDHKVFHRGTPNRSSTTATSGPTPSLAITARAPSATTSGPHRVPRAEGDATRLGPLRPVDRGDRAAGVPDPVPAGAAERTVTSFVGAIRNQSAPVLVYSVDGQRVLQGSVITPDLEQVVRATPGIAEIGLHRAGHVHGHRRRRTGRCHHHRLRTRGRRLAALPDGGSPRRAAGRGGRQRGRRR